MQILAISGSLRRHSNNTRLLRALREEAPEDVEITIWDGLKQLPHYDADDDVVPGPITVEAFRQLVREADAVVFATPEYNSSIPGALKNALDWVSRPFATNVLRHKRVAVIGASQGMFGAGWAQADLRKVLSRIGASVDDRELLVGLAGEQFTADARLRDPGHAARLETIVESLADCAAQRAA